MSESYAVTEEETRKIASMFLENCPALKADWNMTLRSGAKVLLTDEELEPVKWSVVVTEPTGHRAEMSHAEILEGLHWCVHQENAHEAWMIRDWMVTPGSERSVRDLADWVVSRICQAALFDGKFPYGGADLMSTAFQQQA